MKKSAEGTVKFVVVRCLTGVDQYRRCRFFGLSGPVESGAHSLKGAQVGLKFSLRLVCPL